MTEAEIKIKADEILGSSSSVVDSSIEVDKYLLCTGNWELSREQLNRLLSSFNVSSIFVEGSSIAVEIEA